MVAIGELQGRWHRSLISWPDGRKDTATSVTWLQAESLFADLRQPENRPDFQKISSLRALSLAHVGWLAAQEGFAGRFRQSDGIFEWQRLLDFQPEALVADRARLRFDGEVLVEEGTEAPYVEHWHRDVKAWTSGALLLRDEKGRSGALVIVNSDFMFARSHALALPRGKLLADCVQAAPSLEAAQDLVDCEISLGSIKGAEFIIERSTLPFREGASLAPFFVRERFFHADVSPEGEAIIREWIVSEREGDLSVLEKENGKTPGNAAPYAVQESSP